MTRTAALLALGLLAGLAGAAPPALDLPAEVRPVQGYVIVTPKTDAVSVLYVALDGVYPFPSDQLKDARSFVLPAGGLKDGTYKFVAVAAGKGGEQTSKQFNVVIGQGNQPPVTPPVVVPPPATAKYYFAVVRPDGPASAEFTKLMADPAWATLRGQGHLVKAFTVTAAKTATIEVGATPLPAVVTLVFSADGKSSLIARPPIPAPSPPYTDGILKLATFN